jgi:hypothetical protein
MKNGITTQLWLTGYLGLRYLEGLSNLAVALLHPKDDLGIFVGNLDQLRTTSSCTLSLEG